jgi:hypothetical protein
MKSSNKRIKKKDHVKQMKKVNSSLAQNDEMKVIKSYMSTADNTQLKSALTTVGK